MQHSSNYARNEGRYKVMLLTLKKPKATFRFSEFAGFFIRVDTGLY